VLFSGALLCCLLLVTGCATRFASVNDLQKAQTRRDLEDLLGYLECRDLDAFTECLYSLNSLNVLFLERRMQQFRFNLDKSGKITSRQLNDLSVSYHIFPPKELPDYVSQFK
jgi:hypothetical protein